MTMFDRQQDAERRMREIIADGAIDEPDEIEYGEQCIRLLWHDKKVAVIVDIDELA